VILSALSLSLLVAALATVLVALLGTWAGWTLARRSFRGRELLDALLHLPLVLPPTVTGYYLIVLLGRRGWLGASLYDWTGWAVPFTWVACVLASATMALPLMVRSARVAFEQLDRRHELAAATLGHGRLTVFLRVVLPLARRGLLAGRALGEFGATLMLAGNIPGRTQTMPLLIYEAVATGQDRVALWMSLLLTGVSVLVILAASRLGRGAAEA
jgi:molybdate transport system permease protein